MTSPEGEKFIGKYPLLKLLGKGGMGEVWLSHHPGLDLPVAVKMMKAFNSESQLQRFIQEGRLAASINHDNIIRVYDADSDGDKFFLVMEYIKGEDYKSFAKKNGGSLSIDQCLEMGLAVCSALSKAHSNRIFHRDIKPENIMRSETGEIKLADLGIAKRDDPEFQNTMANTPLGTPYYISPEQACDASSVDGRTDIYSLGATFYHLLTGTYPFKADTPIQMLMKHINESLEEPALRNPEIPQEFSEIICKMMEKDRGNRYQSCDELYEELLKFKTSSSNSALSEETIVDTKINTAEKSYDETLVDTLAKTEEQFLEDSSSTGLESRKSLTSSGTQTVTLSAETLGTVSENDQKPEKEAKKFLPLYISLAVIFLMFIIFVFKDDLSQKINGSDNSNGNGESLAEVLDETSSDSYKIISDLPQEIKIEEEIVEKSTVVEVPKTKPVAPINTKERVVVTSPKTKSVPQIKPVQNEVVSDPASEIKSEIKTAYNLLENNKILSYLQRYTHPLEAKKYSVAIDSVYLNWFKMYQNEMMLDAFKEMNASKPVHVSKELVSFRVSQKFSKYLINSGNLPNVIIYEVDQFVNFKKYNGKWYISEDERNPMVKYKNPVYDELAIISSMLKHRKLKDLLLRYTHPLEKREIANNLAILQNNHAYLLYTVICLNLKRQNAILVNDNTVTFKAIEDQYLNFQKYNGKWYVMDDEAKPF